MKNRIIGLALVVTTFFGCNQTETKINFLEPSDKNIPILIDGVEYGIGNWEVEHGDKPFHSHGNHRAVVSVSNWNEAVKAHIQWRRNDKNPHDKDLIIVDAATNMPVPNKIVREINNVYCDIVFQPNKGSDTYYLYYFPFQSTGKYYPVVNYIEPQQTAEESWEEKYSRISIQEWEQLLEAKLEMIQSSDSFNSFFPLEVIAKKEETDTFFKINPAEYFIFPEYRDLPVRMKRQIPWQWINRGIKNGIRDNIQKGEYYTFQLCIYAKNSNIPGIQIQYSDLEGPGNSIIGKENFQCINLDGVDLYGKAF